MINEWKEFLAYTEKQKYAAAGKRDTSYLGRFTFKTLLDFEGIGRILTIIARGYLFHDRDGSLLDGDAYDRADYAYRALCAWCSIPEKKNTTPKAEWQSQSDFREYHEEFPELVNAKGEGWFYRHIHGITRFSKNNPDLISDSAQKSCQQLAKGFDKEWRDKVVHYQVPLFTPSTRASWGIRFEGIVADALTLGPLRNEEADISPALMEKVSSLLPKGVPAEVVCMLIAYYKANKPDDSDWVVLPVASFDAYYGNTNFSRKYLSKIPEEIMERSEQRSGVSRFRMPSESLF